MTGSRHGLLGRAAALLAVAGVVGLAGASPASADPAEPGDYRSRVTSVEPAPEGVEVAVVGGDAFLELRVDEGHEVAVEGYGGEPYLRFRADGTVERNVNSPATYLNDDRMANVALPDSASPDAEPEWERVAGGGTYAWHDHNIHRMAPGHPPGLEPGDVVQEWEVVLDIDGVPTTVSGDLTWVEGVSPLPWAALGLVSAAAVVLVDRRRRGGPSPVGALAALMAAGVALVVGWGQYAEAPAGADASPLLIVVPAAGVLGGVAGLALRRRAPMVAAAGTLAAVAAVVGWGVLRLAVLWMPVLPTSLPANLDRAGTALALGLAVAAAAAVVVGGGLAPALAGAGAEDAGEDADGEAHDSARVGDEAGAEGTDASPDT